MTDADHPDRNRRKLYGRRKGPKLSQRQAGLRGRLLQELAYVPGGDPLAQFPDSVRDRASGGLAGGRFRRRRASGLRWPRPIRMSA